jgi:hypothetical protein
MRGLGKIASSHLKSSLQQTRGMRISPAQAETALTVHRYEKNVNFGTDCSVGPVSAENLMIYLTYYLTPDPSELPQN